MMRNLLEGKYDLMCFSYDLPYFLVEHYDEMYAENSMITEILNDNIPEICADYEEGYPTEDFKQRIRAEYERVLAII